MGPSPFLCAITALPISECNNQIATTVTRFLTPGKGQPLTCQVVTPARPAPRAPKGSRPLPLTAQGTTPETAVDHLCLRPNFEVGSQRRAINGDGSPFSPH